MTAEMQVKRLPLSAVRIGARARRDPGDIRSLAASIEKVGLLQAIAIDPDNELVFGRRRLAALHFLGWAEADFVVVTEPGAALDRLRAELDENVERVPFTPSESADLLARIRSLHAPERREARAAALEDRRGPGGTFAPAAEEDATTAVAPVASAPVSLDEKVARATGYSVTTLKRVARISNFAHDDEHPEVAEKAREALDAIDSGASVKPLLDQVVDTATAAGAVDRWPVLARVNAGPRQQLRMGEYLDGIAASGSAEALEAEIRSIEETWGTGAAASDVDTEAREKAYQANDRLSKLVADWDSSHGADLLATIASALNPNARRAWASIARDLTRIAGEITEALPDEN